MIKGIRNTAVSIRLTVISIFVFVSIVTALAAIGLQYHFNKEMTQSYMLQLYRYAASDVSEYLNQENDKTAIDSALLANFNQLILGQNLHPDALRLFASTMERNPAYNSIYIGFPNGDLTQLVNLNDTLNNRGVVKASSQDRWALVTISTESGLRQRKYEYLDEDFTLRTTRYEETGYDSTKRPWYQEASLLKVNKSDAYLYAQSRILGQTFSLKIPNSGMVLGVDVTLNSLSDLLKKYSVNKDGMIFNKTYLFQKNGDVLASNHTTSKYEPSKASTSTKLESLPYPQLTALVQSKTDFNELHSLDIEGEPHYAYLSSIGQKYGDETFLAILTTEQDLYAESMKRVKTSILITIFVILMLLPMSYFFISPIIRPINSLVLEAGKIKRREYDKVQPVRSNIVELQSLNDSMEEMYHSIEQHEADQKELMESFIKLIAQAIDDKSPYTAGHCNRVPELGLMLADAAQSSDSPPFAAFKFQNQEEHREFRIAAWLHDCGKITTPEHIVDKGTKLETIYNRIHEVRMRFEVLWRDAEIEYYQQRLITPENEKALHAMLEKTRRQLIDDFSFVAQANVGSERMPAKHITRLQSIAQQTWQRHFDDKLGLSPIEERSLEQCYPTAAPETLPVTEYLLSDKKEHIVPRHSDVEFDPKFGIKMQVPEHLYNHGELYNLSIVFGTLTREDRFKINQHIISTIKMLEELPLPPELAKVPRYASTHHETLKGTGYPRKLSAEDLSIPERILVIADIFEALTAADRPYKKAKTLSASVHILHTMAVKEHIDMDLFRLFLTSGVYLQYAEKFLDESQIDKVNIGQYLV